MEKELLFTLQMEEPAEETPEEGGLETPAEETPEEGGLETPAEETPEEGVEAPKEEEQM